MAGRGAKAVARSPHGVCMMRNNEAGFNLVELMVVVAVVAILASIALPSYRQYVLQTNRTDAVRGLTLNAQIMQRCYSQNFTFNLAACTNPLALISANNNYNLTFGNVTNNTYTLTATPRGVQVKDTTCASFTLDQTGRQTALDSGNNNQSLTCWGAN
jgi:type IV pilus assembly protein PilE